MPPNRLGLNKPTLHSPKGHSWRNPAAAPDRPPRNSLLSLSRATLQWPEASRSPSRTPGTGLGTPPPQSNYPSSRKKSRARTLPMLTLGQRFLGLFPRRHLEPCANVTGCPCKDNLYEEELSSLKERRGRPLASELWRNWPATKEAFSGVHTRQEEGDRGGGAAAAVTTHAWPSRHGN